MSTTASEKRSSRLLACIGFETTIEEIDAAFSPCRMQGGTQPAPPMLEVENNDNYSLTELPSPGTTTGGLEAAVAEINDFNPLKPNINTPI